MKKSLIFVILLILPLVLAKTDTFQMQKGDSQLFYGKNITLLNFNEEEDSIIICINNKIKIVTDNALVNGVSVDIRRVTPEFAEFRVDYRCSGRECDCDASCSNELCIPRDQCSNDSDCNDNDETTLDKCEDSPKKCIYSQKPVSKAQCTDNENCNDNNECTQDSCENGSCKFTEISDCKKEVQEISSTSSFKERAQIISVILLGIILLLILYWKFKVNRKKEITEEEAKEIITPKKKKRSSKSPKA